MKNKNKNLNLGVPVQPCFGVEVSFKVPHQIAVGTAKCPAELPVIGTPTPLLDTRNMGSFNLTVTKNSNPKLYPHTLNTEFVLFYGTW
jgi:hypothetical protein